MMNPSLNSDPKITAKKVGNLSYNATSETIANFAKFYSEYKTNDEITSAKYDSASWNLSMAQRHLDSAWSYCTKDRMTGECAKHRIGLENIELHDIPLAMHNKGKANIFLDELAADIYMQGYRDERLRGRKMMARRLYFAARYLWEASIRL